MGIEGSPKKPSRLERGLRSALAGAAFLGAVGGAEVPKGGGLPQMATAEAREAFDANKEANLFLAEMQLHNEGIGDARGRQRLQLVVEEQFRAFALALETRTPAFSKTGGFKVDTSGLRIEAIEKAKAFLRPKLQIITGHNPGIEVLRKIVNTKPLTREDIEAMRKAARELGGEDNPSQTKPSTKMPTPSDPFRQGADPMKQMQGEIERQMKQQQDLMRDMERQQRDMLKGFPRLPGQ